MDNKEQLIAQLKRKRALEARLKQLDSSPTDQGMTSGTDRGNAIEGGYTVSDDGKYRIDPATGQASRRVNDTWQPTEAKRNANGNIILETGRGFAPLNILGFDTGEDVPTPPPANALGPRDTFLNAVMSSSGLTHDERKGDYVPLPNRNTQERVAGALNGPTLNYGSEIAGLLGGAGAAVTGGNFGEGFQQTYNNFERDLQNNRRERPVEAFATEIGTGIATGGGIAGGLKALTGKRAGAVTTGAIAGGISGSGNDGDALQRGAGAVIGLGLGATLGKALQVAGSRFSSTSGQRAQQQLLNEADEFNVPLSLGQATDDFGTRQFERALQRGQGQNDRAQELARNFYREQSDAFMDSARNRFAQGPAATGSVNDAGQIAGDALKRSADDLKRATDEAYEAARSFGAQIEQEGVTGIREALTRAIDDDVAIALQAGVDVNLRGTVQAQNLLQAALPREGQIDFRQIEALRKAIGNMARDRAESAGGATDARQLFKMRAALDGALDDAVDKALFKGDGAFLGAYKNARALRARYAAQFEGGDPAGQVINKIVNKDADAVETINYIFGTSDTLPKNTTRQVIERIKGALGEDSEGFQALRQAAIEKMLLKAQRAQNNKRDLPAVTLANGLTDALEGRGAEVFKQLFTKQELNDLARYRELVKRVIDPPGSVNYSGTATGMIRGGDFFTGRMRELFSRVDKFIGGTPVGGEYAKAQKSFTRPNAFVAAGSNPVLGTAGGQIGGQGAQRLNPFQSTAGELGAIPR